MNIEVEVDLKDTIDAIYSTFETKCIELYAVANGCVKYFEYHFVEKIMNLLKIDKGTINENYQHWSLQYDEDLIHEIDRVLSEKVNGVVADILSRVDHNLFAKGGTTLVYENLGYDEMLTNQYTISGDNMFYDVFNEALAISRVKRLLLIAKCCKPKPAFSLAISGGKNKLKLLVGFPNV